MNHLPMMACRITETNYVTMMPYLPLVVSCFPKERMLGCFVIINSSHFSKKGYLKKTNSWMDADDFREAYTFIEPMTNGQFAKIKEIEL